MSEVNQIIDIPAGEHHVVRVFAVDIDETEAAAFNRRNGTWPLRDALGTEIYNPDAVAFFPISDLSGVGLAEYLQEGQGVDPEQITPIQEMLDAMQGYVLVLPSSALGDGAQELHISTPLTLVATLAEDRPPVIYEPLPSVSALGVTSPPGTPGRLQMPRRWKVVLVALLTTVAMALYVMVRQ